MMKKNLFDEDNPDRRLRESFCLFLDLLGFSNQVKAVGQNEEEAQKHFDAIYKAFDAATKEIRYETDFHRNMEDYVENWNCRLFSDNVAIGCPLDGHYHSESLLWRLIEGASRCQLELTLADYFVRGGCAVGPLYMNDLMIYGTAMIDAYEMESQYAIYPAIALTEKACQYVHEHTRYYQELEQSVHYNSIYISQTGHYFMNYLHELVYSQDPYLLQEDKLFTHKKLIIDNIARHEANPKVQIKYKWAADYHNFFCEQIPRDYGISVPEEAFIELSSGFKFSRLER